MTATVKMDELGATSVSEAVIMAIVRVCDVDPLEIPPLGQSVNPMALDLISEGNSFAGSITFQYEDYEITVTSDGDISVAR